MARSDLIDIACEIKRETEKAYAISDDGENIIWVPKSQVEFDEDQGTMAMPEWLAEEKGLI